MKYTCPYCGTEFESNRKNVQTCGSEMCKKERAQKRAREKREEQDRLYYDDKDDSDKLFCLLSKEDIELCLKYLDFLKTKMRPDRDIKFSEASSMLQSALSLHIDLQNDVSGVKFSEETEAKIVEYIQRLIYGMFPEIAKREHGWYRLANRSYYWSTGLIDNPDDEKKITRGDDDYASFSKYVRLDKGFFERNPRFAWHTAPYKDGRYIVKCGTDSSEVECLNRGCKNCYNYYTKPICVLKQEIDNRTTPNGGIDMPMKHISLLSQSEIINQLHKCDYHCKEIRNSRIKFTLAEWLERNFERFEIDDYAKKCVYEILEHKRRAKRWRDTLLMSKVELTTDSYIKKKFMEENKILMAAYHKYTEE